MIRILLAEDDDVMREYLTRALTKSGYAVESVDRGTTALELIKSGQSFDLLLTDIVMPEMDGIELAQKAAIVAPMLRVMFITGFSAVSLKAGQAMPNAKVRWFEGGHYFMRENPGEFTEVLTGFLLENAK